MFLGIYIFALAINVFLIITRHKTKVISVFSLLIFGIILIGNKNVADYINYESMYTKSVIHLNDLSAWGIVERGYKVLEAIFLKIGMGYNQFRTVMVIISLLIFHTIVENVTENPHTVYFLYGIFLVFMDAIQIRFFYASILIMVAYYFYTSNMKGRIWKATVSIATSVLIQSATVMYVVAFGILKLFRIFRKHYKIIIVLMAIIGVAVIREIDFTRYSSFIVKSKLRRYAYTRTNLGFLFAWIIQAIQLIRVVCVKKRANIVNADDTKVFECFERLTYGSLIFLPVYIINLNFYRYLRGMFFLYIVFVTGILQRSEMKLKWIVYSMTIIECIGWFLYELLFDRFSINVLVPIFG